MIAIAIADDHLALSEGLELFINQQDSMRVLFKVTNGKELLHQLEQSLPDVVLTDINMPEINGVELCRRIKTEKPHIKVIALSMFDNQGAIDDMSAAGADGYVLKSSPLIQLKQAILEVCAGQSYFDPQLEFELKEIRTFKEQKNILSRSERDILVAIAKGKTSQEIAADRGTAVSTVNKHRKNIINKLGLQGKKELMEYALERHGHTNSNS
ncbi:response regulator transcription factor [Nonlabens xiamenensis]|uniref:response regulator transcription factor n=1 Tax=Nonlabens xiamenensis TaxID=2341043 RepID=UPI000F60505A|nr:response regulator transcription factor [Nonlabens xiamenensis]